MGWNHRYGLLPLPGRESNNGHLPTGRPITPMELPLSNIGAEIWAKEVFGIWDILE